MDENTNNLNQHPEVVTPDSQNETTETPSSPETHQTESTSESVSSAPDVPASNGSEEVKPEESSAPTEVAPTAAPTSEDPKESGPSDVAKSESDAEKSPAPAETAAAPTPAVIGTPSVPADDSEATAAGSQKPVVPGQPDKKKLTKLIAIVVIVVLLAVIAIVVAMSMGTKKTPTITTKTTATTTNSTAIKVNTWTGKADTYNWDTAANWSLGVPVNGQSLVFNVASIKMPSGNTIVTFQDNVTGLTISKLTINGTGVGFVVKGSPLTITGGISQDITLASKTASPAQVNLENSITFSADQLVQAGASNNLTFNGLATPATTTIGASTVQFSAAKSGDIEVSTPLVGTGEIEIPASTTTTGNIDFNTASPDFKGSVVVNKGATVGMGNQNATGTGVSSTDAFGTSAITVADGAYLELNEVGSNTYTVPNTMTVSGNGAASASQDNGAYTGAVSSCITKAQQGCSDGATVTFTGTVTLTGNTQFGAFYGVSSPQVPPSTTVTYTAKNLVANGHTLSAVAKSKAVVTKS